MEELYVGGQVSRSFCGDRFVQMLVAHLVVPGAKPLRKLTVADFGLKDDGILALITLLLSTEALEELNIGRNGFAKSLYYLPFKMALRVEVAFRAPFSHHHRLTILCTRYTVSNAVFDDLNYGA